MLGGTTTVTVDFGVIATAVAPSVLVGVTFWIARLQARAARNDAAELAVKAKNDATEMAAKVAAEAKSRDLSAEVTRQRILAEQLVAAKDTKSKLEGIHTLVNDQLTREKQARLLELKSHAVIITKLVGPNPDEAAVALLDSLHTQAVGLELEITQRDEAAATLTKEQSATPEYPQRERRATDTHVLFRGVEDA